MAYRNDIPQETWDKLRLEYISSSDVSIRGLEKKHGIPYSMIRTRCQNEKWLDQREELRKQAMDKSIDLVSEHQAEECSRAFRLANKVMDKLEAVVDRIEPKDEGATREIKNVTSAIKDLKEIGVFRSAMDRMEQMARINKLWKDAEEEQKDTTITVKFESEMDEYAN